MFRDALRKKGDKAHTFINELNPPPLKLNHHTEKVKPPTNNGLLLNKCLHFMDPTTPIKNRPQRKISKNYK